MKYYICSVAIQYCPQLPSNFTSTPITQLREYPFKFGLRMVELYDCLLSTKRGQPTLPSPLPRAVDTFQSMEFGSDAESLWAEADIIGVCHYLRGGKNLRIPEEFRPYLPQKL